MWLTDNLKARKNKRILTFEIIANEWLESKRKEVKESTFVNYSFSVEVENKEVEKEEIIEDVKKIEENISNEIKVINYFDINLIVKINNQRRGNVTKLANAIELCIPVPSNLPTVKDGYTRQFIVIRVHNGVVAQLPTTVQNGLILFETDRFSIYALAYNDVKNEEDLIVDNNVEQKSDDKNENQNSSADGNEAQLTDNNDKEQNSSNNNNNATKASNPRTGDNIILWVSVCLI